MSRRNESNIGQTNQTSVKIHHNPGGKSNWSFGWGEEQKKPESKNNNTKYHNESQLSFGDKTKEIQEQEKKKEEERKRKEEEMNSKLPTYDPKNAGKSSFSFGTEKTDYRKKDEVYTSVKVHNPPGGRSNIQFG